MPKSRLVQVMKGLVDDEDAWARVGPELARCSPQDYRRFLIAAQAIVAMHRAQDPDAVLHATLPMLDSTDGYDA